MKELLVTLLSYVPSSNLYYKHLINNSKDETLKQLRFFILFDFCSTSFTVANRWLYFFLLIFFYSFKQDALSSSSSCFFHSVHSFFSFILKPKVFYLPQINAIHLIFLFRADRIERKKEQK